MQYLPTCVRRAATTFALGLIGIWGSSIAPAQLVVTPGQSPDVRRLTEAPPTSRHVPGRYVIEFVAGTPAAERADAARGIGAQIVHNYAFSPAIVVTVPNAHALEGLRRSRSVWRIAADEYAEIAAKPPAVPRNPNNLIASVAGSDVSLSWNDRANNETSYKVLRCSGAGCNDFADHVTGLPANTESYVDLAVSDGTYRYQVVASNANGDSKSSNALEVTVSDGDPPPPPPPPPTPDPDPAVRGSRQILSYAVQRVGRPVAGSTGFGIGVAVVDTGIDFLHADLAPAPDDPGTVNPVAGTATGTSFNALAPGTSCQDTFSHGTHLAGLIGAVDNNIGIVGVAPEATMYCVKVGATDEGLIALSDLQAGLEWVLASHDRVEPNIKVVNLSLAVGPPVGDPDPSRAMIDSLIQQLYAEGVVTVVSAGNNPSMEVSQVFPANVQNVVSVGGTTATLGINTCSLVSGWVLADTPYGGAGKGTTDGSGVTISAPGEERADTLQAGSTCTFLFYGLLSTSLTGTGGDPGLSDLVTRKLPAPLGPSEARGTSFSAALVSGVMARLYQAELEAGSLSGTSSDVAGVTATLVNTADRVNEAPLDHPWAGVGIVTYDFDGVREGIAQAPMPAVP